VMSTVTCFFLYNDDGLCVFQVMNLQPERQLPLRLRPSLGILLRVP
jgi:hypothetical protein